MSFDLRRSSIWSIAEVCISGASLFLLYKFVIAHLGVKALGVWSLVLATTSLARLGDIGASAGLSRFVALAKSQKNQLAARNYVETAFLANALVFSSLALLMFWPLRLGLELLIPTDALRDALTLLPYSMGSFVLLNLSAVTLSALIGQQRTDLKSKVVVFGILAQLTVTLLSVPQVGLVGMAWGQIAQYIVTICAAWTVFLAGLNRRHRFPFPTGFRMRLLRDLFSFGIRLQLSNLVSFAFEPATKFSISAITGLEALGIFEMAYRMVLQVRHLTAAPTVALIPAFVHLSETSPPEVPRLYDRAVANVILGSGTLLSAVFMCSPAVSLLWIGSYSEPFVTFTCFLCIGWFLNTLGIPSYQLAISRGLVKWNVLGHLVTSMASPALVLVLGKALGPIGAVFGVAAALGTGAVYSMVSNCRQFNISSLPPTSLIWKEAKSIYKRLASRERTANG